MRRGTRRLEAETISGFLLEWVKVDHCLVQDLCFLYKAPSVASSGLFIFYCSVSVGLCYAKMAFILCFSVTDKCFLCMEQILWHHGGSVVNGSAWQHSRVWICMHELYLFFIVLNGFSIRLSGIFQSPKK